VIDTVNFNFLLNRHRHRRLSLRFLSWFEFEERGVFDGKLEELYRAGKQQRA
jgi:hypothetical protein